MGLLQDGLDLQNTTPAYNTFANTRNQFGGTTNKFAGREPTIQSTVRNAVTNSAPVDANPFRNGGPGGDGARRLAERERQMYKDMTDYYWQQEAAKKAFYANQSTNPEYDQEGQPIRTKYKYDYESAPDWLVGRNVSIPEESKFKFPANTGFSPKNPVDAFYEFRKKFEENPDYDIYTGVYHKDYYPQEWIDMARYYYYLEDNAPDNKQVIADKEYFGV